MKRRFEAEEVVFVFSRLYVNHSKTKTPTLDSPVVHTKNQLSPGSTRLPPRQTGSSASTCEPCSGRRHRARPDRRGTPDGNRRDPPGNRTRARSDRRTGPYPLRHGRPSRGSNRGRRLDRPYRPYHPPGRARRVLPSPRVPASSTRGRVSGCRAHRDGSGLSSEDTAVPRSVPVRSRRGPVVRGHDRRRGFQFPRPSESSARLIVLKNRRSAADFGGGG